MRNFPFSFVILVTHDSHYLSIYISIKSLFRLVAHYFRSISYSSIAEDSKQESLFCQMREIFSEMIVDMKVDNMLEEVVDEMAREVVDD